MNIENENKTTADIKKSKFQSNLRHSPGYFCKMCWTKDGSNELLRGKYNGHVWSKDEIDIQHNGEHIESISAQCECGNMRDLSIPGYNKGLLFDIIKSSDPQYFGLWKNNGYWSIEPIFTLEEKDQFQSFIQETG